MQTDFDEKDVEEWFDSEEEDENSVEELSDDFLCKKYSESQVRIVRTALDFTLHTLVTSMKDGSYINLSPDYQRRARWDRKKKSLLIESLLMNIPVPSLFLFETDYNQYEVMDGRQRLEAITEFINDEFSLSGMEFWPELRGRKFSNLPGVIQRGLLRRTVNAVVLLAETHAPEDVEDIRLILFRRLNTGGVKLNPQELRNALYPGEFNKIIQKISRSGIFCKIWGIPTSGNLEKNVLYKSMMDCELALRFFAIRDVILDDKTGSLRKILDFTMKKYSHISEMEALNLESIFIANLSRVSDALSTEFHRLPNGLLSRPLYDAVLVAAFMEPEIDMMNGASEIKKRFQCALHDDKKYDILVGRGNTTDAIKSRVALARSILTGN